MPLRCRSCRTSRRSKVRSLLGVPKRAPHELVRRRPRRDPRCRRRDRRSSWGSWGGRRRLDRSHRPRAWPRECEPRGACASLCCELRRAPRRRRWSDRPRRRRAWSREGDLGWTHASLRRAQRRASLPWGDRRRPARVRRSDARVHCRRHRPRRTPPPPSRDRPLPRPPW